MGTASCGMGSGGTPSLWLGDWVSPPLSLLLFCSLLPALSSVFFSKKTLSSFTLLFYLSYSLSILIFLQSSFFPSYLLFHCFFFVWPYLRPLDLTCRVTCDWSWRLRSLMDWKQLSISTFIQTEMTWVSFYGTVPISHTMPPFLQAVIVPTFHCQHKHHNPHHSETLEADKCVVQNLRKATLLVTHSTPDRQERHN